MNVLKLDDARWTVRVLVGDVMFEDATVTIDDGWLHIDFDMEDLDSVAIDLQPLADAEIGS